MHTRKRKPQKSSGAVRGASTSGSTERAPLACHSPSGSRFSRGFRQQDGTKDDDAKPRYDLLPPIAVAAAVDVLTYGAMKYDAHNWESIGKERYLAALQRHVNAWHRGERLDAESGLPHLSHVIVNAMFLLCLDEYS